MDQDYLMNGMKELFFLSPYQQPVEASRIEPHRADWKSQPTSAGRQTLIHSHGNQ